MRHLNGDERPRLILGIESSCDETACAIVRDGHELLGSVTATQNDLHARYEGVVPEVAARAHMDAVLPVATEALARAGISLDEIDAVAAVNRPGLVGSLMVGLTVAKTLAVMARVPLVALDHIVCHLYPDFLDRDDRDETPEARFPMTGLIVSGGHTSLVKLDDWDDVTILGSTVDDAAGEAFDKVSIVLGLGYPGGPAIEKAARDGDARAFNFPRSMMGRDNLDFSFSGLKTAVLYTVTGHGGKPGLGELTDAMKADLAASFQAAVVDVLAAKTVRAIERTGGDRLVLGGGVVANTALRERLIEETGKRGIELFLPPKKFCTDNAAMVAGLGWHVAGKGHFSELTVDAIPT